MTNSSSLVRSRYRTLEGGCVSCSGDLASVQSLPGVRSVDALASGLAGQCKTPGSSASHRPRNSVFHDSNPGMGSTIVL